MDVCELYRIRYSEFLAWDRDDREKAVAHQLRKAETCPDCGTHPELWDPDRGGDWNALVPTPVGCRGCELTARGEAKFDPEEWKPGTRLRLRPPPPKTEPDPDEGG